MSRLELSRGSKGLWQRVEALWRSMLPRQARVTRTDGSTVWVRFIDEGSDAPESQFPSTVAGVPVGTMGWVITLGGKKGLFIATAVAATTRFSRRGNSPLGETTTLVVSTFSQAKSIWASTLADEIPEATRGTWTVKITASVLVQRSVSTGGVYFYVAADGQSEFGVPRGFAQDQSYSITRTVVVEDCTGDSPLEIRYGGQSTSATTQVWDWSVDITAVEQ